jgi:hypothetical protein
MSGDRDWDRTIPKYLVTRDLHGPVHRRLIHESPVSFSSDDSCFQYSPPEGLKAGQEVELTSWPHTSMRPINQSGRMVMEFFRTRMKSRMALRPWNGTKIVIDDGLTSAGPPKSVLAGVITPMPREMGA